MRLLLIPRMLTLGVTTEFSLPKLLSGTICATVVNGVRLKTVVTAATTEKVDRREPIS